MAKPKNYINNASFFIHLVESQRQGSITNELASDFILLSERIVNRPDFVRYPFRDDLIATGILACVQAYDKFMILNALGLAMKNGILKEKDNIFTYKDGDKVVTFGLNDVRDHRQRLKELLIELEDDGHVIIDEYTEDPPSFNYVLHNSPYSYYTQIIINSYIAYIKKEYSIKNIKAKLMVYDENGYTNTDEGTAAAIKKLEDKRFGVGEFAKEPEEVLESAVSEGGEFVVTTKGGIQW